MKNQTKKLPKKSQTKRLKAQRSLPQTFGEHIAELRRRLLYVGLVFLAGSTLAYTYREELLTIILAPLDGQQLVYLTPGGGFSFIFHILIYAGLILAAPALVYHLHAFIRPALPAHAQKSVKRVTLLATALIISGVTYGYFVAIPSAIQFLSTFTEGVVAPNLTADSYLSFFLAYVGGLALLSLVPLLVIFWHWISPLTPGSVLKGEQWIVVMAFVLAAIITPTPDAFNQVMIAGPVIAAYQIGVVTVLVNIARTRRQTKKVQLVNSEPVVVHAPALVRATQPVLLETASELSGSPTAKLHARPSPTLHRRPIDGMSGIRRPKQTLSATQPGNRLSIRDYTPVRTSGSLSIDGLVRQ